MTATAGMMVGEDVKLLEPLGEGGMGAVWVGKHLANQMEVAVKFIHRELAEEDPTLLERFKREGAVLRQVRNPHVVKMYEENALPDGTPYIVMELLRGETLVERLERTEECFELDDVTKLLDQFTVALGKPHDQGIVHRDLKGENVFLIGQEDQICLKVLDFGCARTPDMPGHPKLTAPGVLVGSPEYMSPEQIVAAAEVDHHADLWAVAVLVYVATVLALPFSGDKLSEVFGAIRSSRFTPPSALRPDLPPAIDVWFERAFSVDRHHRFASIEAMRDAWREAIAPPPSDTKKPIAIAIAVAVALVVLLGLVLAMR